MSKAHPIVAVTGSSGAGTSTTQRAISAIFKRLGVFPALIQGDGFHRYTRKQMQQHYQDNSKISHFNPNGNDLSALAALFEAYSADGTGRHRQYLREGDKALGTQSPGSFGEWQTVDQGTDLLFYEGLHGGLITDELNIAQYVDLLIGVVPVVNLEWQQQIFRNTESRSYTLKHSTELIMRRIRDYADFIVPQFARTDINFQRIPTIDTSNPFEKRPPPRPDQTMVIIKEQNPAKTKIDFAQLLALISGATLTERDSLLIPGQHFDIALQLIMEPLFIRLIEGKTF